MGSNPIARSFPTHPTANRARRAGRPRSWVILDSDCEAEFFCVAEAHPRVNAYVKNHNLGFEVPYRYGSDTRKYLPDFIVLVDDGRGSDDLLHLASVQQWIWNLDFRI